MSAGIDAARARIAERRKAIEKASSEPTGNGYLERERRHKDAESGLRFEVARMTTPMGGVVEALAARVAPREGPPYVALARNVGGLAEVFFRMNTPAFQAQGYRLEFLSGPLSPEGKKAAADSDLMKTALAIVTKAGEAEKEAERRAESIAKLRAQGLDLPDDATEEQMTAAVKAAIEERAAPGAKGRIFI